jgi:hypothetical protein
VKHFKAADGGVHELFDALESRALLSVTLFADRGLLVEGNNWDNVMVIEAGLNPGVVLLHGVPGVEDGAEFTEITWLIVRGREGNDTITVEDALLIGGVSNPPPMPVKLNGGVGDDTINGGPGPELLIGFRGERHSDGGRWE